MPAALHANRTIHFVSLGCAKNRVDTEIMLGVSGVEGFTHVDRAEDAEVIVINTCGFIGAAKEESVDTILEMAAMKDEGQCESLVVAGCLSQRYPEELAREMPEVDHFLGSSDMLKLGSVLRNEGARMMVGNPADYTMRSEDPRRLTERGHSAYVKIAEGCNRSCSFCAIPSFRGKQRSRTIEDLVQEAERLVESGVVELNLISQDTISYGRDLSPSGVDATPAPLGVNPRRAPAPLAALRPTPSERDPSKPRPLSGPSGSRPTLAQLARALGDVEGAEWVRLHYLYPETLTKDLIDVMANHPKVLPYIDMPLQHASTSMLKRMRRGHGGDRLYRVVDKLRESIPDMVFRTTFIVGHPGETDEDFDELVKFVQWAEFDHVGVFLYSPEEGTRSGDGLVEAPEDAVEEKVAKRRHRELMRVQRPISKARQKTRIGTEIEVLVDGISDESEFLLEGRWWGQAPEVDGKIYLANGAAQPGELRKALVTDAADYDLVADLLTPEGVWDVPPGTERPRKRKVKLRTLS